MWIMKIKPIKPLIKIVNKKGNTSRVKEKYRLIKKKSVDVYA